ncbi:hypothetical protein DUK53_16305 [Listeria sp. SHR_NRA_18]|uniref:hypothetical protein n=1 Tax=Listeria sp. SHR_NRA_18 TaxID=2269046 RepID=UPI00051D9A80|nr:hypothetical protein [Listeria sp. SHR_NRA_18]KGL44464.1 hypothetical protein EP56_07635 [Listeriaceae bacterium FSL A5-0209]RQW65417.1 hypothetical protein DUK53_16305 [Listeria sp. SHR_NRA_18]
MKKTTIFKISAVIMMTLSFSSGFDATSAVILDTQKAVHAAVMEQKIPESSTPIHWDVKMPSHSDVHENADTPLRLKEAERLSRMDTRRRQN